MDDQAVKVHSRPRIKRSTSSGNRSGRETAPRIPLRPTGVDWNHHDQPVPFPRRQPQALFL
jgi:hypothetical protein